MKINIILLVFHPFTCYAYAHTLPTAKRDILPPSPSVNQDILLIDIVSLDQTLCSTPMEVPCANLSILTK